MSSHERSPLLGFIGGTGPEGRGLALRFAVAGYSVLIGSRSLGRAMEAAEELSEMREGTSVQGVENGDAARGADILFLTIPYAGMKDTLPAIASLVDGKIVVSSIAPVEFQDGRPVALRVESGSAAQEAQELLPGARVVSAFQTVDAHQLQDIERSLDTDVLVCSDDVEARRTVVKMASELHGVRGLSGGRLSSSRYVEECTALLITLNRIYKSHSGLRITGIDR
ncbi:MAG: NADPH-dependent F420 reductase [Sphingomicrobium sp.]